MIGSRVRTYLNQDQTEGFSIFKQAKDFYILLKVSDLPDIEVLENYCTSLTETIVASRFTNASEFDAVVSDAFKVANLPLSFSIACLYLKSDTVFLKTYGHGAVVLRREGRQVSLVKFGAYASGKVQKDDEIVLCFGEHDPFIDQDNSVHIEFGTEELPTVEEEDMMATEAAHEVVDQGESRPTKRHLDIVGFIKTSFAGRK